MSSQRQILKCRQCKIAAEAIIVDSKVSGARCPKCGIAIEGDAFRQMQVDQARYLRHTIVQDMLRRAMPEQRGPDATIRHQFTQVNDPGWEFIIELEV